jgi:hypothetical protein
MTFCEHCGTEFFDKSDLASDHSLVSCRDALVLKLAQTDKARIEAHEARNRVAAVRDEYACLINTLTDDWKTMQLALHLISINTYALEHCAEWTKKTATDALARLKAFKA